MVIFLLTQRENMGLKTDVQRSNTFVLTLSNGKTSQLNFSKISQEEGNKNSWFKDKIGVSSY